MKEQFLKFWEPAYKFLKSTKLAIVLILYLAVTSGLSTFIPQGEEISLYYQNYSPGLAWLVTSTQFYRFFQSIPFILPVVVFFLNLLTCSIVRLVKRLKSKSKKRFGPDIIHFGILLLIVGALLSPSGRKEEMVFLGEGDSTTLSGGYELVLKTFEFLKYEDGRPKDWLSEVDVIKDGDVVKSHTIEVNKPLKIGKLKVFQSSYSQDMTATLSDLDGETFEIMPGDYYTARNSIIVFRGVEIDPSAEKVDNSGCCPPNSGYAVFEELSGQGEDMGHTVTAVYRVGVSEVIDGFTIEKICISNQTGLQVVEDPSFLPVLISLILIGFGISLAFIQKIGDKNI